MLEKIDSEGCALRSFTCRCVMRGSDVYAVGSIARMCQFFGTTEASYRDGILARIRRDISGESADAISRGCLDKAARGEDFRIVYRSKRAGGIPCDLQMDGYAGEETPEGRIYDLIIMDITDLVAARREAGRLAAENTALTEDSPVGLGVYHIRGDYFDLVYTNEEYYRVHYGSRAYWDRFKGQNALGRILPEDRSVLLEEWSHTLCQPGHVYDARYRCLGEDGKIHWIRLMARLTEERDGERICYASYVNIDREKAAEALAQRLHRSLLKTIHKLPSVAALFCVEGEGRLRAQSFTEEYCRMLGCTQEEAWKLYGANALDAVHPEDRPRLQDFLSAHAADRGTYHIAYRLLTGSGSYKWVSVSFVTFQSGEQGYLYAVLSDIDEVKRRDELLEKEYLTAQSYLDSLAGTYLAAMRVNVSQGRVESVDGDDPLMKHQGPISYDAVLQTILPAMPRERDRRECLRLFSQKALLEAYRAGERTVSLDYYFCPPQGGTVWARNTMNLIRRPGSDDIIAFDTVEDIHKSKILEIVVKDVLIRQYDLICCIDAGHDTIYPVSAKGGVGEQPPVREPYESGMRAYVADHVLEEEQAACMAFMSLSNVRRELEGKESCSASFTVREGERLRNKRLTFSYIDREVGLLAFVRTDFTEVQKTQLAQEEQLRDALRAAQQASVAKSSFLSRMSHEIRTPMNAIIGMDTLAAKAIGDDEKVSDCISKIGISARYLLSLINDILDMSRIESGKMLLKNEKFLFRDFMASINGIIYGQAAAKGLDYECLVASEVDEAYLGDAMKLQQVLINVLGNAVKFTSRGKVTLDVQQISRNGALCLLRFTVGDTGCGISEMNLERIFEPFEQEDTSSTTSFGGTGLGLAITKNLVGLMGGSIHVRSILGVGSEFTIDIPLTADESILIQQPAPDIRFEKLHTLVVDDDVILCEQASSILRDIGMIGEWVASGREAVERVRRSAAKSLFYDFILIDWKMPDMDGVETTRQIRRIVGPEVTIIIISAYDWETIEAEARAAGADLLVSKPLFKSTLISAFQKARGQAEAAPIREQELDFTGRRILLAEDNQINAEIARSLLELRHFTVDLAPNGLKALEMFTQTPVGYYDAVLMDVRMPIMDGLQAASNIRHWDKADAESIPIIAMTANAFDEDIDKSRAAGMNVHLSKPIEPELLYRTLYRVISEREDDQHRKEE